MPVDEEGNRADIVMDPNSTISRMNLGRLYEQYINAASRDVLKRIRTQLEITEATPLTPMYLEELDKSSGAVTQAWEYLMGYYKIVSPRILDWFSNGGYGQSRHDHLTRILREGIHLYIPPENETENVEVIKQLEQYYRPVYGPVTYIGNSGKLIKTKNPVRIGSNYFMLLEKIGDDWTAVSSGKVQHHGILSPITNQDKYASPSRNQAIKALGESEVRIYSSYAGPEITAEIMDRNNNPLTHKEIVNSILEADKPTDIDVAVDRSKLPLGSSKPLQLINHIAMCGGWRFHYSEYDPTKSNKDS